MTRCFFVLHNGKREYLGERFICAELEVNYTLQAASNIPIDSASICIVSLATYLKENVPSVIESQMTESSQMRVSMLEDRSEPAGSRGPGLQRRFTGAAHSIGPAGTECFSLDDIDNLAGHCTPTADSALSAAVLTAAFCEESASLAGQECAHAAQDRLVTAGASVVLCTHMLKQISLHPSPIAFTQAFKVTVACVLK